jgi:hypothetical protein
MEWILAGEFELEDGSQAKIWFKEGEWECGEQARHSARITVASFDPDTGTPRLATNAFMVSTFAYP